MQNCDCAVDHSLVRELNKCFLMTHQNAACDAVEHQVLRQDTGEISPGRGRERGKVSRKYEGGGGSG